MGIEYFGNLEVYGKIVIIIIKGFFINRRKRSCVD
jgi:hypothetical protein